LTRLSFHKLYIDEIYDFVLVRPYRYIAERISLWDFRVLPAISDGIGYFAEALGGAFARLQNGVVAHYAAFAFAGIVILLLIVLGTTA
jgi:NADH-quinone oxidoreductase subunit L